MIAEESADPSLTSIKASHPLSTPAPIGVPASPSPTTEIANSVTVLSGGCDTVAYADADDSKSSSQVATETNQLTAKTVDAVAVEAAIKIPATGDQVQGTLETSSVPTGEALNKESKAPVTQEGIKLVKETTPPKDSWCDHAKGKRLSKKGEAFTLPSGEACIKIPNSIIEKNRKSWEPFVLGQFYSDPPSQGTLHNIVNGIWSKQYRDIAVSKMEGFAFLFRIPNAATRARVVKQKLWQIEGQTMFVDRWEPGVVPTKPELTSAPIWLELRKVPLQFFNEDGLERIAGLVGEPKFLHPMTANKTNLEVAKVFTIIDPRKPLPEAVNVQFDSGEISRVLVSSPWMPPVCDFCKEIEHVTTEHSRGKCTQKKKQERQDVSQDDHERHQSRGRKTRRGKSKDKQHWVPVSPPAPISAQVTDENSRQTEQSPQQYTEHTGVHVSTQKETPELPKKTMLQVSLTSKLGTVQDKMRGETSGSASYLHPPIHRSHSSISRSSHSDVQPDSSDVESSDSELEEGEFSRLEPDFEVVRNKKNFSGRKGNRGKGPKN